MTAIVMPKLSDSMESGLVLEWLIDDGHPVAVGDDLLEIETDKATMAYQSELDGILQIVVPAGTTVPVGEVIAHVGAEAVSPAAPEPTTVVAHANRNGVLPADRALATPLAKRLATVHGISLDELRGSGPRGRITKADVLSAAGQEAAEQAPFSEPVVPQPERAPARMSGPAREPASLPTTGGVRLEELSRLQQVIARRMSEAKATIPHFQVQTEVAMDAALALRRELKAAVAEGEAAPSVNDLIVKAAALALRRHPHANGSYLNGAFALHDHVNVGVAVAADGSLVVPTVFDADTKSLGQISADTRRLAERVRSKEITPPELSRATFTVSNLGMFGMTAITPVINPPEAAILGVGAIRAVLARVEGEIVDRTLLTLTLSCDHRILYGADAARFLAELRDRLERPFSLCL